MTAKELRDLTQSELELKLKDLKQELFNLRFQLAINQLDNPMRINAHYCGQERYRARFHRYARAPR